MAFTTTRSRDRDSVEDRSASRVDLDPSIGAPIRGFALGDVEVRSRRSGDGRALAFWIIPKASPGSPRAEVLIPGALHPNVLRVFNVQRVENSLVLATERVDCSLWAHYLDALSIGRPGVARDLLVDLLADVARGLDAIARQEVPEPMASRVTPWTIALAGGVAKLAPVCPGIGSVGLQTLVPAYLAPECRAGWRSRHSDQYSLAVTYCHLRGGRLPTPAEAERRVPASFPRFEVPLDLTMIPAIERPSVARALSPEPERRWATCRAFVEALRVDILAGEFLGGSIEEWEAEDPQPVLKPISRDRERLARPVEAKAGSIAPAVWLLAARGQADRPDPRSPGFRDPRSRQSLMAASQTRSTW